MKIRDLFNIVSKCHIVSIVKGGSSISFYGNLERLYDDPEFIVFADEIVEKLYFDYYKQSILCYLKKED